ncbi:hypothetical protein PCCS19_09040 [Paenibacillus sp. CCS19]|nr:hypothetical protein PCCS19_09040 [Paenibacillus cellulosilyticus]
MKLGESLTNRADLIQHVAVRCSRNESSGRYWASARWEMVIYDVIALLEFVRAVNGTIEAR